MRKLFLMLAVLLVASVANGAPDVDISCAQVGETNEVIISYSARADVNIPRAFGLDIQLDNAKKIHNVTVLDPNYWVYPGSYPGSDPVGDPGDSSDTLPGEDSNGVTIEMASLHSPPEVNSPNAPEQNNELLSFTVSGSCNVSISSNAARGKVVFYDATNEDDTGRDVNYSGCEVYVGCFPKDHPDYDQWVLVGEPNCWCCERQCHGDADCAQTPGFPPNYWVSIPDLDILKAAWNKELADVGGEPNICADFDHAPTTGFPPYYRVSIPDLDVLKKFWNDQVTPEPNCLTEP